MSDLPGVTQVTGGIQNGTARAARGAVAVSTDPHREMRTPTDVMRARQAREKRKAEQDAARQREAEGQGQREQEGYIPDVLEESPSQRRQRPQRTSGGQASATAGSRLRGKCCLEKSAGRRPENIPPPTASTSRPRATTVEKGQPRPAASQQPAPGTGASRRPRNDLPDPTNAAASQVPQANNQPSQPGTSQPPEPGTAQPTGRPGFPYAFERWETLSSHWEGLTSYWVRRLEENSNEMNDKPLNQQMSRQIADLSAAGANLFHAVVELQRLRASSERKFHRWFYETKQEQKRAQDVQAELERLLMAARDERANALASANAAQADRMKAEDLVKEMRRELQISKEEARRAWEELGRREQEERERTISLRNGEPTLVGGVQVVPMTQGVPSRHASIANRPTTRDGPYAGGPGPSTMGGQQVPRSTATTALDSPSDEQRQFTYEAQASSPTETDPFTESSQRSRQRQPQDPEGQQYSPQQRVTQPPTSSAAIAAARAAQAPAAQQSVGASVSSPSRTHAQPISSGGNGSASRLYQQESTETTILGPTATNGPPAGSYQQTRPGTTASHATDPSDPRSYIPSTASGNGSEFGEEEDETNPDSSLQRDAQGRRIPYSSGSAGGRIPPDDISDEYDVATEPERGRLQQERYVAASSRVPQGTVPPPLPSAQAFTQLQQGQSAYSQVTASQPPDTTQTQELSPADCTGHGWGGEAYGARNTHPTRLSDILEERSSMNSPRASYASGGVGEPRAGATNLTGAFPSSRAPPTSS